MEQTTRANQLQTSHTKKSVAPNTSMWIRMNSRQVIVFLRCGAGGMP